MSWLSEFDEELGARRVRRSVRERLVAELADHLACEEGQPAPVEPTRLGGAREIAAECAEELATDEGRRSAFVAFAALALTAIALFATQMGLGAIGYPGYDHGLSAAISLPSILGSSSAPRSRSSRACSPAGARFGAGASACFLPQRSR